MTTPSADSGLHFELAVDLGEGSGVVKEVTFETYFSSSQLLTFRFGVPFELEAEPCQGVIKVVSSGNGLLEGDVLRAFSTFQMRYDSQRKEYRYGSGISPARPAGPAPGRTGMGMINPIQEMPSKCLFIADGQPHQQVIDALLANTADKAGEIVMLFERETRSFLPAAGAAGAPQGSMADRSSAEPPHRLGEHATLEPLSMLLDEALASSQARKPRSADAGRGPSRRGRQPPR